MPTREVYTGTGSLAGRRRVRNGLRLHGLVLTAVYGRRVTVGSNLCMLRSAPVPRAASTRVTFILHIQEYMPMLEGHWCGPRRQRSLCRTEGRWCGSRDSTPELTPL